MEAERILAIIVLSTVLVGLIVTLIIAGCLLTKEFRYTPAPTQITVNIDDRTVSLDSNSP